MSNSNNIYNILGKLESLTPKQEEQKPAQPVYESVEAKGSIREGVSKIEQKLSEQLASMKEASYVHKGTYGTEYQGDSDDEEEEQKKADAGKRGRGRPRKHAPKVKVAGRGKGRPKKEVEPFTSKSSKDAANRLQDLMIGKMPKKTTKGTLVKGKAMSHDDNKKKDDLDEKAKNPYAVGMAQAMKSTGDQPPLKKSTINKAHSIAKKVKANESTSKIAQRMLSEGINFRKMAEETGATVDEMLEALQTDINDYRTTGSCSERLRDFIELHNHAKKQLADAVRPEDIPAFQRKQAGKDFPITIDQVRDRSDNISSPEGLAKRKQEMGIDASPDIRHGREIEEELDDLAKLAGLTVSPKSTVEAKEYGNTDVEEAPEHANSPDEEVENVEAITDQGNDLNRQKKQFAGKPKAGDNPMASEGIDPIEAMGRKLMKEYESIKVQK